MPTAVLETFAPLSAVDGLTHGFVLRDPDTRVDSADREQVLEHLRPHYARTVGSVGIDFSELAMAEQVHGDAVALIGRKPDDIKTALHVGVDGLIAGRPGVALGIYVADCCAVYLVDPKQRACALVHSGRKGSELGIAVRAIEQMVDRCASEVTDLIVVLSPCIRPPAYEVDFAAEIRQSVAAAGVPRTQIHDSGRDTSQDLQRYYSYRMEKGHTGRMLAFLGWDVGKTVV